MSHVHFYLRISLPNTYKYCFDKDFVFHMANSTLHIMLLKPAWSVQILDWLILTSQTVSATAHTDHVPYKALTRLLSFIFN